MKRHLGNLVSRLFFPDQVIEEETLNANTNVRTGDDGCLGGLPVDNPVFNKGHGEEAIRAFNDVVGDQWDASVQSELDCVFNHIRDSSNKEDFEEGADICDKVTKKVNVDVEAVNVANDIYSINFWNNLAGAKGLR